MLTLALFCLFALCAIASLLVLVDSGMRGVDAWHRLRRELRTLSGECGAQLAPPPTPATCHVTRSESQAIMQGRLRVAA